MTTTSQKGIALILTMILLLILSVMAVSLLFLAQTETWSTLNYRLMDQARDVAEAGINGTANYIQFSYVTPGVSSDPLSNYTLNSAVTNTVPGLGTIPYPITVAYNGNPVVLSTNGNVSSNYPIASAVTNFQSSSASTNGSVTAGYTTVNYTTSAVLLSMRSAQIYNPASSTPTYSTVQTWLITADAAVNGTPNAQVELSAILEREITPAFNYAVFADAPGCAALQFGGGGSTDSYDSSVYAGTGTLTIYPTGGNVGTNGNLTTKGSPTTIGGSLSTPRTGVGSCTSSNVTAWSSSGGSVTAGLVELPQNINYPTPPAPIPAPPTTGITLNNKASDCGGVTGCSYSTAGSCTAGDFCLAPGTCPPASAGPGLYGNITVKGNAHLSAGCYNINSFTENGGGTLIIDSGPVIMNIAGTGQSTPLDITGGGISNPSLISGNFQMIYAGTGTINLKGGGNSAGLMYAPNASYSFNSAGGNWFGAVVGNTMTDMGGATVNYDRELQKQYFILGNYQMSSFTWKKY